MPLWWSAPTNHHAFSLSLVSLVITIIAAVVGIVGYAQLDDSLILIYGLENVVDFFSSAIVLWRFNTGPSSQTNGDDDNEHEILSKREKRASIGVSIILAILGFGGFITAIEDLVKGKSEINEDDLSAVLSLSFLSFFIFAALAKFKFHYARMLQSPSLRKDGLCSGIGAILAFAMFFNAMLAISSEEHLWWWLDPVVALLCSLGALVYGLYCMYKAYVLDGYPIFNYQWWLYGGGGAIGRRERRVVQHHSQQVQERQQQQQQQSHEGDLELQQTSESLAGNPTMNSNSSISMMKSKSGDEDMSDIVIT